MIDKYELLELFENEPKVFDEEVGIYEYERTDAHGFVFTMNLILCEGRCSITLKHKDLKYPIFDLGLDEVNSIKCKEDKLIIQQTNNSKNVVIYFKPNYFLRFEDRLDL